jgi:hypothetical protein
MRRLDAISATASGGQMGGVAGVHFDLMKAGKTTKRKTTKRKSGQVRNARAEREPEIVGRT